MVKYGLTEWVRMLRLDRFVPGVGPLLPRRRARQVPKGATRWEIVRMALEELGPTFIKIGQLLSNRTDILPIELIQELTRLQDEVQPIPRRLVLRAVEDELGRPIEDVFVEFDREPVASASIAQVHRAVLKSGELVGVKLQRPGIESKIETDLDIVAYFARLAERYIPASRYLGPSSAVKEFRKYIRRELDFSRERQNMERFATLFAKRPQIKVLATYPRFSTKRLLIMEYAEGVKIRTALDGKEAVETFGFDPRAVAENGAELMLEQILIHGFFHADPHPGNIMILPDNVLCFLDFGLVGRLHEEERDHLASAITGMVRRDGAKVTDSILRLTRCSRALDYEELVDEVQELVDDYLDRSLKDMDIAVLFSDLIGLVVSHGLTVPTSLMMVAKALLTIEGVGRNLYPDFTLQPVLEGLARRLVVERLRPARLAHQASTVGLDYLELLRNLPSDLSGVSRQLRTGQLTIGFRLRGLEPLRNTLDNIGYRLIFGIVLAALMISSALIIHARLPPLWNDIPLIGLAGFGVAGILGLGFLFSIISRVFKRR